MLMYIVFPAPITTTTRDFKPLGKGVWETTLDVPSCGVGQDNRGPWCYQKCYDSNSPLYLPCQRLGERHEFSYNGVNKVVLCPTNANYFEQGCVPVSVN